MSRTDGRPSLRKPFAVVRATWGCVLLLAPGVVLDHCPPVKNRERHDAAVLLTRVLGARHLAQAMTELVHPTPPVLRAGMLADVAHAGTGMLLALRSRRWRRVAVSDATFALALAGSQSSRTVPWRNSSRRDHGG